MKRLKMTSFSIRFPWFIMGIALAMIIGFGSQFPKVSFDNDPENMLAEDEYIRVFHNEVKERYNLYDFVIVGIVNEEHEDGIFNVETLGKIDALTHELISLRQNAEGKPEVLRNGKSYAPELQSDSAWERGLAKVFGNDVNRLFTEDGSSAIIAPEIISPSVVDNIKQADRGQLAIEYLMEEPPATQGEALAIKRDAMNNPLYKDTLVSADGKAIALYIPIQEKTYSYNVANLIENLTADWDNKDTVYITGQPVAQDTFGVEMLVQMATSAPMAGLAIFLLLLFFFRRFSLIIAPMIVAVVSVVATMGLLIGLGYDVHIMSSMIAIFLMPIAVADSVHILSEFFDSYHKFRDKAETLKHVVGHLFMPMLYTTLTTIAGFASLGTTPIPPVKVFGLHVAFGVGLAWLLTMTFVPAYIMIFVKQKTLDQLKPAEAEDHHGVLGKVLGGLGKVSYKRWKLILTLTMITIVISVIGISRIQVNDNPVKWFTQNHRIRVADRVMNDHFGGTYTAYLTLNPADAPTLSSKRKQILISEEVPSYFPTVDQDTLKILQALIKEYPTEQLLQLEQLESLQDTLTGSWNDLADVIIYLDPETLTQESLIESIKSVGLADDRKKLIQAIKDGRHSTVSRSTTELKPFGYNESGTQLQERALAICDEAASINFRDFFMEMEARLNAPAFKRPELLAYVESLQDYMKTVPGIGKSNSAVDSLKKANYELNYTTEASAEQNAAFNSIPPNPSAVSQVFIQLEGMKKKDSLFHMVTKDYNEVNIWIQLKSGDNTDMLAVVDDVENWMSENPAPVELNKGWAGLTYLNVVWQDKMVAGMMNALLSSFVVVLIMMMVLFRSPIFGLLAMIPLTVTITLIYGIIGWVGKDYDMPVAVLSSLTLGLSVDFAIHFLERSRELTKNFGSWKDAIFHMFQEPAMAISRNAIIISIGFTPLLFAPLVPYKTVGFFLATIMAVSWIATLFILAALITGLQKWLFKNNNDNA